MPSSPFEGVAKADLGGQCRACFNLRIGVFQAFGDDLGGVAANMRIMRGNLLDVLNAQYVTTARAKGLTESKEMMIYS